MEKMIATYKAAVVLGVDRKQVTRVAAQHGVKPFCKAGAATFFLSDDIHRIADEIKTKTEAVKDRQLKAADHARQYAPPQKNLELLSQILRELQVLTSLVRETWGVNPRSSSSDDMNTNGTAT